jgi:hypothetical protein
LYDQYAFAGTDGQPVVVQEHQAPDGTEYRDLLRWSAFARIPQPDELVRAAAGQGAVGPESSNSPCCTGGSTASG